jgi:hypothetical protein
MSYLLFSFEYFLVINVIKIKFGNKIKNEFISDSLMLYIKKKKKKKIAAKFCLDSIVNDF